MANVELESAAREATSKTILAADESGGTIAKRFVKINVTSTPETNRTYRQILFTAPGVGDNVSGVILFDETIRQSDSNGTPFPKLLADQGIVPGIKVDQGTVDMPNGEKLTKGLDGLAARLSEYKALGARFAKWRAVITIGEGIPTDDCIGQNSEALADYAKACQDAGIVPIVEPEVIMDGPHSFERDLEVTRNTLTTVFEELRNKGVDLTGIILKPNMVTSGTENPEQADVQKVAQTTLDLFAEVVPAEVPAIAFLSGGQSPDLATEHLNAINKIKNANPDKYPWRITASYGRALQGETLEAWGGKPENVESAQQVFISRAQKVFKASKGEL